MKYMADQLESQLTLASALGLSMSTAVNAFLRAEVRAKGIPFDMKVKNDDMD